MNFPNYFADAESDFSQAEAVIVGLPYEKTSSFRHGADQAPKEIRQASWNFETYDLRLHKELQPKKIHDYGDLEIQQLQPAEMVKQVSHFISKVLSDEKFPICIGGEHSVTAGILHAYPKDTCVLSLDAHLDFRESYENEKYNHSCVIRRIADHLPLENITVLGFRSAEKEELDQAKQEGLHFIDYYTLQKKSLLKILQELVYQFKDKPLYITLDIDVIDPAHAPGTSTPEPFGFQPQDILTIFDTFAQQMVGFDLVEVCPPYDTGITSLLAAKYIRSLVTLLI